MKTFSSHRQYICIFITTLQNILKLSEFNPIQSCSMQDQYIVENQFYFSILTVNNWNSKCKRKKCNLQSVQFSSVQLLSHVWLFTTQLTAATPGFPPCPSPIPRPCLNSCPLSQWCHLTTIFCHPLLLHPSIFASIRVFPSETVLHIRWPNYWSFSFNINPSSEYSGLISFRMEWLILLAVQGTLNNFLQRHSSKASVLWHSAFSLFFSLFYF